MIRCSIEQEMRRWKSLSLLFFLSLFVLMVARFCFSLHYGGAFPPSTSIHHSYRYTHIKTVIFRFIHVKHFFHIHNPRGSSPPPQPQPQQQQQCRWLNLHVARVLARTGTCTGTCPCMHDLRLPNRRIIVFHLLPMKYSVLGLPLLISFYFFFKGGL